MSKALVVATSRKTRGGITSVVKAHEQGQQWKDYNCEWIETHIDGSAFQKVCYFFKGLLNFIRKIGNADIVHIHMAAVERKMPFVFLARLLNKVTIIHIHFPDPQTTIYNPRKAWKYRWCLKKADCVVALSHSWKQIIEREWGIRNIEVIYNPCPIIFPEPNYKIFSPKPYILYAGNLSERKGYKDLLAAFAKVKDKMPEWKILFAGNGELDKALNIAVRLGIKDRIELLGWISGEEKDRAFRNASVYCLPSYAEGFPMGVLDAWSYNLPVITTPVGGLPEIIDNGRNALSFKPGDVSALADCLIKISDACVRENLSRGANELSSGVFNIATINRQVGLLYEKLLSNRSLR